MHGRRFVSGTKYPTENFCGLAKGPARRPKACSDRLVLANRLAELSTVVVHACTEATQQYAEAPATSGSCCPMVSDRDSPKKNTILVKTHQTSWNAYAGRVQFSRIIIA